MNDWLIYGANGYTGELVAELAASRGHKPVLAGRSADKVRPLAERLGLPHRAFALDSPAAAADGLRGVRAVLHCAGPFSATSAPMLAACLQARAHYLDITGEIDVFEACFARDADARAAGVAVLPGVGLDVVPSDCLAARCKERLPSATSLELALASRGGPSGGTLKTSIEGVAGGGRVRRAGRIERVPMAHAVRKVPFADKPRTCMAIPWGDVSTAWHSTRIPDITVFMAASPLQARMSRLSWIAAPFLRQPFVLRALQRQIGKRMRGPTPDERRTGRVELWGRASDGQRSVELTMTTPEGYTFTAESSLMAVQRALGGGLVGALTPSQAFGAGFAESLPGVTLRDRA